MQNDIDGLNSSLDLAKPPHFIHHDARVYGQDTKGGISMEVHVHDDISMLYGHSTNDVVTLIF